MKKILITGGSGFIGTNLVESLLKKNYTVLNIDKAKPLMSEHLSCWKQVDILNYTGTEKIVSDFNPEIIIHLAAVTDLKGKDLPYYDTNITGTKNIINISSKITSLKKVIFTSSMYVCKPGFIPDDYNTYNPHTLYGESKMKGELLVKELRETAYQWVIIRPTSIWGPWFNIPYIDFFDIVYQGKYYDFGRACTKTYGFVDNTVLQIEKLMLADGVGERVFYLGDNPAVQISEWANEISIEMGKRKIQKIPFRIIRFAALIGDMLYKANIKFPITSFRLLNLTTNNILPLNDIYEITGPVLKTRLEGVKKTIKWLTEERGYKVS